MSKYLVFFALLLLFAHCTPDPYTDGAAMFKSNCGNCHMDAGEGLRGLIPPLQNSDYWVNNRAVIPCLIRNGLKGPIVVNNREFSGEMLPNPQLSEIDIVNICNYVQAHWYKDKPLFTLEEVRMYLEKCQE